MRIAVTGGAGSIGSALVGGLVLNGHEVVVMDNDEYGLYNLALNWPDVKSILGDVAVEADVRAMMGLGGIDLIYNCAAIKHITFCEQNPAIAERTNVLGNRVLCSQGIPVIFLSTDKAVEPSSQLGWTKYHAEQETIRAGGRVVRLCNVEGTRGTFFETAQHQAAQGVSITLTDERIMRWFIGMNDAVSLLLRALSCPAGSILVPQPPVARLINIAERIEELFPGYPVVEVGIRAGEKLYEELAWLDEVVTEAGDGYCVMTALPAPAGSARQG